MTYTFTADSCYDLADHTVVISGNIIKITLDSTSAVVLNKNFSAGVGMQCQGNDLCLGTLTMDKSFVNKVNLKGANPAQGITEANGANEYWGTDEDDQPGITHRYNLNKCPIKLSESGGIVKIECPCGSTTGTCQNPCYKLGS